MPEPITLYKLIVLYMLHQVDFPLTTSQISSFYSLIATTLQFFTLQSVLSELSETGMIRLEKIRNTSYYTITDSGQDALHYFQGRISADIREDIDPAICSGK